MIRGVVNAHREATVPLRVRGPNGVEVVVTAVVDTGLSASLMLPTVTVAALALTRQSGGRALLADGSICQFDLFSAEVDWFGLWRPVLVTSVGEESLLGMGCWWGMNFESRFYPAAQSM